MWSKTLPAPNRWLFTGPGREAFLVSCGRIVTLRIGLCKCFLWGNQLEVCGAINKEIAGIITNSMGILLKAKFQEKIT